MITGFFLSLPAYLIMALFSLFPAGQPAPQEWVSSLYLIWSYINSFSFIVPVDTLLSALVVSLTFHLAIFLYHAIAWLLRKIPGMN